MKYSILFSALGAVALLGCLLFQERAAQILIIYIAFNCFIYAAAYAFIGPRLWQKRPNGSIPLSNYFVLAPLHILNWLALLIAVCFQKEKPLHQVTPGLWLGRRLLAKEANTFSNLQQLAVLDLTSEISENKALRTAHYLCLPLLDHRAPTKQQIAAALAFMEEHISKVPVFVHCALGHGRSATLIAAWLLAHGHARSVESAVSQIQAIRKGVALNAEQMLILDNVLLDKEVV